MARRNMKGALDASMRAEANAIRNRFEVAESVMAGRQPPSALQQPIPELPAAQALNRVVRDSFTMPVSDYELITEVRDRCLNQGISATKAEVLRAALAALSALPDDELLEVLKGLPKVKTGRPTTNSYSV